jgi:shikimate kinase
MTDSRHIILTGMKHTGKSTLARLLGERLSLPFCDTDALIAELSGKSPRALYDEGGATLMMRWETEVCRRLAERPRSVVATGGGLADNGEAFAILKDCGTCVFIDTPFDALYDRVMASARRDGRLPPFLDGPDPRGQFYKIFSRRTSIYDKLCDIRIDSGNMSPDEIISELLDRITHEQTTDFHS